MLFSWLAAASTALSLFVMTVLSLFVMVMPFAIAGAILETPALLMLLQNRFPPVTKGCEEPPLAILVPGGGVETYVVAVREGGRPPGSGARVTAALELARAHPSAKLVLSGAGEADPIPLIAREGIEPNRIIRETESHNTFENAAAAARILHPERNQCFILVTSALHMPRAVGSYRAAGFTVSTRSVDFRHVSENNIGDLVWNELIGLVLYRLAWRTYEVFPRPENKP